MNNPKEITIEREYGEERKPLYESPLSIGSLDNQSPQVNYPTPKQVNFSSPVETNNQHGSEKEQGNFQPTLEAQKKSEQLYDGKKGADIPDNRLPADINFQRRIKKLEDYKEKQFKKEPEERINDLESKNTKLWWIFGIIIALILVAQPIWFNYSYSHKDYNNSIVTNIQNQLPTITSNNYNNITTQNTINFNATLQISKELSQALIIALNHSNSLI